MKHLFRPAVVVAAAILVGCQSNKPAESASSDVCHVEGETVVSNQTTAQGSAAADAKVWSYGGETKLTDADAVSAAKVVADPAAYADKHVRVTGTVSDVCSVKGCWLRVAPTGAAKGSPDLFIKFADPPTGRLVPAEALGQPVTVEGTLKQGTLSEKAARHFKEDAGAAQEEIEKIVGPQKQLLVSGAVVQIQGIDPRAAE